VTLLVLLRELTSLLAATSARSAPARRVAPARGGGRGGRHPAARAPRATRALGPLLLALAPLPLAAVVAARLLVDRAPAPRGRARRRCRSSRR
jgi:hypothetical protein